MNKRYAVTTVFLILNLLSLVLLSAGCTSKVSQEEYERVCRDLVDEQMRTRSIKEEIDTLRQEMLASNDSRELMQQELDTLKQRLDVREGCQQTAREYIDYLEVLMHPVWKQMGLTPRTGFHDNVQWLTGLKNRAVTLDDTTITELLQALESGDRQATTKLWFHCIQKTFEALE